jgi:drug/metabolite transporter (DMT)-like permease
MAPWFLIGLITPTLASIGNFIDKFLIERYLVRDASVWVLSLYSALISVIVAPILLFFAPNAFHIPLANIGVLMFAGMIEMLSVFLYLSALRDEETSTVVPLFQTIPIFSFVLGFVILGETLGLGQILAGLGVIVGSIILTLELEQGKRAIKWVPLLLMLSSSFCFAFYDALFKWSAIQETFWVSLFWQHVGAAVLGLAVFVLVRAHRRAFLSSIRVNGKWVFGLNTFNEVLNVVGTIAIVATVTSYQPIFVFIIGLAFTLFFPKLLQENIAPRRLFQKVIAIAIIVCCSLYLATTT